MFAGYNLTDAVRGAVDRFLPVDPSWADQLKKMTVNHDIEGLKACLEQVDPNNQTHIATIDSLCRQAIALERPARIICVLISALPDNNRLSLFIDKTAIPSPVVRENHVELANFYLANEFKPQVASSDVHYVQAEMKALVLKPQLRKELEVMNASLGLWGDVKHSQAHAHEHSHDHFHIEDIEAEYSNHSGHSDHSELAEKFVFAQQKMAASINVAFGENFDVNNAEHRDQLFLVASLIKMLDESNGGARFISQRRSDFYELFQIKNNGDGLKIGSETRLIPDGKAYLIENLGLGSLVNDVLAIGKSIFEYIPVGHPLFWIVVAGLPMLLMRQVGNQELANTWRDNVGAVVEAGAFSMTVGGPFDQLIHSVVLVAPAYFIIGICELLHLARSKLFLAENQSNQRSDAEPLALVEDGVTQANHVTDADAPVMEIARDVSVVVGPYHKNHAAEAYTTLEKIRDLLMQAAIWGPLNDAKSIYQNNDIENTLNVRLNILIEKLELILTSPASSENINQLILVEFKQELKDIHEILTAYKEVCDKNNPTSHISDLFDEFSDIFGHADVLSGHPSQNAKEVAFCLRYEAGLMTWVDRINSLLPELPSKGELAGFIVIIGAFFATIEAYKAITGEKKDPFSHYVLNSMTYMFKGLKLDPMYDNLGGGAAFTEWFKAFFNGANVVDNLMHVLIAFLPFFHYKRVGSDIFKGIHHAPVNGLAYWDKKITNGAMRYAINSVRTNVGNVASSIKTMKSDAETRSTSTTMSATNLQADAGVALPV